MDFLFGADMPLAVRFFVAFVVVLALIGATAFLVRRFGSERLGGSSSRGRQPRLAVIDAAPVDARRRLILIRRDNVEHLLMIGGPSDLVVEANIARAATAARDATGPRPPAASTDTLPRAVPLGEGNMWPLQPTPEPAAPPLRPPRHAAVEEPMQWHPEPEPPPLPPARRPELRPEVRPEPRPEYRAEPRAEVRQEARAADPLAGLAAELSRVQGEPAKPRPVREFARAPRPERGRPAPAPVPVPALADEPFPPNADQNLADMAHQLEAALRRPKPAEPRAPEVAPRAPAMARPPAMPEPMPAPAHVPMAEAMDEHATEPHEDDAQSAAPPMTQQQPARAAAPKPPAPKSVYDSLEQEMASLLGRPNSKT